MAGWFALAVALQSASDLPAARPCTAQELADLITPSGQPYRLACQADTGGRDIRRRVLIEGQAASGAALDCGGGEIRAPGQATTGAPTVAVWSHRQGDGWSRPSDVAIRNCGVAGNVRIWGMGAGGSMRDLLASSRTAGHTLAAQSAAPIRVVLDRVRFQGVGTIPLYVGPGVTQTTVTRSRFSGRSTSVAIYLDAESAGALIQDNDFDIRTGREQIAVDGSGANRIVGNRLALDGRGGVFLYRNCGEDGVIRHQTPSYNRITDNVFTGAGWFRPRAVVIGSREGRRSYCGDDRGWPFGSSIDDGDGATGNLTARNSVRR
ncbi:MULTISPECIES: right-handed parallel beta-helix repeat-containing protein [unclassified Brevundimonas]|uniref:right-handed parallel beta-helix repeat-containing protein n=2 Tax=unclassified Brevundimonas TaxID=2622653 RepID=UPI002002A5F9|nr:MULTISPECIES: right-handed parallel beta-helix repeat-containing protein [unclassified Brevundimonas]MCK6105834.1 right-handed parallel beta-helix repeat-containing protein [Brevundimonas sp. EYE_349]